MLISLHSLLLSYFIVLVFNISLRAFACNLGNVCFDESCRELNQNSLNTLTVLLCVTATLHKKNPSFIVIVNLGASIFYCGCAGAAVNLQRSVGDTPFDPVLI